MTTNELRAAERQVRECEAAGLLDSAWPTPSESVLASLRTLARAYLAGPSWHARPPVPGHYVFGAPSAEWELVVVTPYLAEYFSDRDSVGSWFGPIPPDPEAAP